MTAIAVWIGVDGRGPASAYIATDSRISWTNRAHWDHARKAFASSTSPDLFAYSGDVLFPSMLLSQFVSLLDTAIPPQATDAAGRFASLEQLTRVTHESFPRAFQNDFTIVHVARVGHGMDSEYQVRTLRFKGGSWTCQDLGSSWPESTIVLAEGSGRVGVLASQARWDNSSSARTSRACYSAFVEALGAHDADPRSGGPPQLVGLYRMGPGRSFGLWVGNSRYLNGVPVHSRQLDPELEWRNELFERCDSRSPRRIAGAQRHVGRT